MKIVRIFEDIDEANCLLWAVVYEGNEDNEYDRLFDQWNEVSYLEEFFTNNYADLDTPFWKHMSKDEAVNKTLRETEDFEDMFYEIAHGGVWGEKKTVLDIFKPLVRQDFDTANKKKYKTRPDEKNPFLRLYAVRLEDDTFVITGGSIKLTKDMTGRKHLEDELDKLTQVKHYLKSVGISYLEDLTTE